MNQLAPFASPDLPALLTTAEPQTQTRFWEFFAAQIRNKHTRRAYGQATGQFLFWCENAGVLSIADVKPLHVATYIEQLGRDRSAPTVKQHLVHRHIQKIQGPLSLGHDHHRNRRGFIVGFTKGGETSTAPSV